MKEHLVHTKLASSILKIMNKEAVDQFAIYYLIEARKPNLLNFTVCVDMAALMFEMNVISVSRSFIFEINNQLFCLSAVCVCV